MLAILRMLSVPWMELNSMEAVLLLSLLTEVKVAALPAARRDTGLVIAVMLARGVEDVLRVASFAVRWDILPVIVGTEEVEEAGEAEGEEADTVTDTNLTAEAVDAADLVLVLVPLGGGLGPGLALVPPEGGTADPGPGLREDLVPGLPLDPDPGLRGGLVPGLPRERILAAVLVA